MALTTIIAGCDLSPSSDHALDRAVALAERHRAKLVLVNAQANDAAIPNVDNAMLEQIGEVSAAVRADEARQLAERYDKIAARGVHVDVVSRVGPPDEVLAGAALEQAAELIVVGTHGRTGISRFLLGSVASAVLRHAPCDVLVVRGVATGLFAKPLVATDFSDASVALIERAARMCAPQTAVEVVHAWQLPVGSWGATLLGQARFPWSTVRDAVVAGAQTQADKLVAAHPDIPIHVELVQGPPTQVVTSAAEKHGHDLIVLGAHGHRGVRRLLLGSVAESTVRHAPCSALVVHAAAPAP